MSNVCLKPSNIQANIKLTEGYIKFYGSVNKIHENVKDIELANMRLLQSISIYLDKINKDINNKEFRIFLKKLFKPDGAIVDINNLETLYDEIKILIIVEMFQQNIKTPKITIFRPKELIKSQKYISTYKNTNKITAIQKLGDFDKLFSKFKNDIKKTTQNINTELNNIRKMTSGSLSMPKNQNIISATNLKTQFNTNTNKLKEYIENSSNIDIGIITESWIQIYRNNLDILINNQLQRLTNK